MGHFPFLWKSGEKGSYTRRRTCGGKKGGEAASFRAGFDLYRTGQSRKNWSSCPVRGETLTFVFTGKPVRKTWKAPVFVIAATDKRKRSTPGAAGFGCRGAAYPRVNVVDDRGKSAASFSQR